MTARRKPPALVADLEAAKVSPAELAAVTRIDAERVAEYVSGDAQPDSDDAWLIRHALDGSYRAELALERVRRMQTLSLSGSEDPALAGIEPPYGTGHTGPTGGPSSCATSGENLAAS